MNEFPGSLRRPLFIILLDYFSRPFRAVVSAKLSVIAALVIEIVCRDQHAVWPFLLRMRLQYNEVSFGANEYVYSRSVAPILLPYQRFLALRVGA